MKHVYVCEKCGTQFEDYDECCKCENSHLDLGQSFASYLAYYGKRCTYKHGDKMPRTCVLVSDSEYSSDSDEPKYYFASYKLERMLTDKEAQEILDEKKAADEEARIRHEKWQAEYEARKAAEQTA